MILYVIMGKIKSNKQMQINAMKNNYVIGIDNIQNQESIFNLCDINDLLISLKHECLRLCYTFNYDQENPLQHKII